MPDGLQSFVRASFVVLLLTLLGLFGILFFLYQGETASAEKDIIIPHGTRIARVTEILHQEEIVDYPQLMRYVMRFTGGAQRVRAGEFRFRQHMRAIDAIRILYYGEPIIHSVTIPEGFTGRQIADLLKEKQLADPEKFIALTLNMQASAKYNLMSPTLEGFLFPDTYEFSRVDGEERIVERMVHRFFERFDKNFQSEALKLGWSVEKVVTMASIIEKETGVADERALVSSVFHNRLKKRMRLQSDPTTIYGIANFNGNLTRKDLQTLTPYNTYQISALPPGAIANPGLEALIAAMRPAKTDYLYFVANKHGAHIFSKTYSQHTRHVNNYQRGKSSRAPIEDSEHEEIGN